MDAGPPVKEERLPKDGEVSVALCMYRGCVDTTGTVIVLVCWQCITGSWSRVGFPVIGDMQALLTSSSSVEAILQRLLAMNYSCRHICWRSTSKVQAAVYFVGVVVVSLK